jgi:hypothetical protein
MPCAMLALGVLCACRPYGRQETFDDVRWKAAPQYSLDETRLHMVEDVERRVRGISRADVEILLGPQSDPSYFRGWDLRYWLGPNGIDGWWLLLRFKDGRVSEEQIASD